jgi:hypothetical protein
MNIESRGTPSPPLWEDRLNQGRYNMLHEVLCIKYALSPHQIEQAEAVDAPNTREHKLSGDESRVNPLRHFAARDRLL